MRVKSLVLTLLFLLGVGCASIAPTPLLFGKLIDLNNETHALYLDCSEGRNYVPSKEGCDLNLLSLKVDETRKVAVDFIKADNRQPHGFDIYLEISTIYFRMYIKSSLNEYTNAERIARQFFETQKAHSGSSIDTARFWWTWYVTTTASKQLFEDPSSLTPERELNLLLALEEGNSLLNKLEGSRLQELEEILPRLKFITDIVDASDGNGW